MRGGFATPFLSTQPLAFRPRAGKLISKCGRQRANRNDPQRQAHMDAHKRNDYQTSYDQVADEYVRRIFDELQHKPLDRQLLDRFAASVRDVGPACDMGCGPGHVARYLHEHGVQICGIDLSLAMVERARRLTPGVEFRQGDMVALDAPDEAWAGIVAFYSIIHIPRGDMARIGRSGVCHARVCHARAGDHHPARHRHRRPGWLQPAATAAVCG